MAQAEELTGIEVIDFNDSHPRTLLPYGIIDPGRMTSEEFKSLLVRFPDLLSDYQVYLSDSRSNGAKFQMASSFTENVPIDEDEISKVIEIMFQKRPGKFEIR